jgi:hypothetical protein
MLRYPAGCRRKRTLNSDCMFTKLQDYTRRSCSLLFIVWLHQHIVQLNLFGHRGASVDHSLEIMPVIGIESRPYGDSWEIGDKATPANRCDTEPPLYSQRWGDKKQL